MTNKTFSLEEFVESQGGKMASGANTGNMVTALVRWKRNAEGDETFPRFTTDGTDIFGVDGNVFGEQNKFGKWEIHKNFKEFFKNLTSHDFWLIEYRTEDEHHFITKFINMEKRLPADSRAFLDSLPNNQRHNFGFLTQKAAAFKQDKFWYLNEGKTGLNHPFPKNSKEIEALISAVNERQAAQLEQLKSQGYEAAQSLDLTVKQRLAAGLGVSGVYETGMTLHPVYGIPYLPGSAIKGVLRNFVINELFRDDDKASEAKALNNPVFCQWFGCPEKSCIGRALKGRVVFMDAFPQGKITVKADVMTPHFQKYYMDESNRIPPADWLEPNPVVFLTVEKTKFVFGVAVKKDVPETLKDKEGNDLPMLEELQGKTFSELVARWLPKALQEHGIGAKTAVGYGLFS